MELVKCFAGPAAAGTSDSSTSRCPFTIPASRRSSLRIWSAVLCQATFRGSGPEQRYLQQGHKRVPEQPRNNRTGKRNITPG